MRFKVEKLGLNIQVDSAGTIGIHSGQGPDPRMVQTAKNNGIDISFLRARKIKDEDFTIFDHIYVMDRSNLRDVQSLAKTIEEKEKVKLILDVLDTTNYKEVPDPYYGAERDFIKVFELLDKATDKLIEEIVQ
jgi:protein-tyrosine phosphatase